jgi:hypothetical protein
LVGLGGTYIGHDVYSSCTLQSLNTGAAIVCLYFSK